MDRVVEAWSTAIPPNTSSEVMVYVLLGTFIKRCINLQRLNWHDVWTPPGYFEWLLDGMSSQQGLSLYITSGGWEDPELNISVLLRTPCKLTRLEIDGASLVGMPVEETDIPPADHHPLRHICFVFLNTYDITPPVDTYTIIKRNLAHLPLLETLAVNIDSPDVFRSADWLADWLDDSYGMAQMACRQRRNLASSEKSVHYHELHGQSETKPGTLFVRQPAGFPKT